MTEKEQTPFETIKKRLPRIDFDSLNEVNRSVEELLADERYCNFLTGRPLWYLDRKDILNVTTTSVFRSVPSGAESLEVDVLLRNEDSYLGPERVAHVSIPVVYLTDRKMLEQDMAAEKAKQEQRSEEDEYQKYLELQKKYGGGK